MFNKAASLDSAETAYKRVIMLRRVVRNLNTIFNQPMPKSKEKRIEARLEEHKGKLDDATQKFTNIFNKLSQQDQQVFAEKYNHGK